MIKSLKVNMSVDVVVKNPEKIWSVAEVDDTLLRLQKYEREFGQRAGVGLLQNNQIGGQYLINDEALIRRDVVAGCARPFGKAEWYVKLWPQQYFEDLHARLVQEQSRT